MKLLPVSAICLKIPCASIRPLFAPKAKTLAGTATAKTFRGFGKYVSLVPVARPGFEAMYQGPIRIFFLACFSVSVASYVHSESDATGSFDCIVDAASENASNKSGYEEYLSAPERIAITVSDCKAEGSEMTCSPGYLAALSVSPALFSNESVSNYEGSYDIYTSKRDGMINIRAGRFYANLTLVDQPVVGESTVLFAAGPCTKIS